MVFWVPFLASLGHGKPTQLPQPMQPPRPWRGWLLMASGGRVVVMPRAAAPRLSTERAGLSGSGGIG